MNGVPMPTLVSSCKIYILVIPNLIINALEVVRITIDEDDDTTPPPSRSSLQTQPPPPLTQCASIDCFGCRAEPNHTGCGPLAIQAPSHCLFCNSAVDTVILFNVNVVIENLDMAMGHLWFPRPLPHHLHWQNRSHTCGGATCGPLWGVTATLRHQKHRCVRCRLSPLHGIGDDLHNEAADWGVT